MDQEKLTFSSNLNRSDSREDKSEIIAAYYEFLISANQWLSHKATDVRIISIIIYSLSSFWNKL